MTGNGGDGAGVQHPADPDIGTKRIADMTRTGYVLSAVAIWLLCAAAPLWAADYVVTFIKETYKAQPADNGGKIYHTWSVETQFGNKLLVLQGDDLVRRQWLQEFSKDSTLFLLHIPDGQTGAFELNKVVAVDVTDIHPIDESFTGGKKKKRK